MRLISWGRSFLWTYPRIQIRIASHGHLALSDLLLGAGDRILPTRHIIHIHLVNIRLILRQILLWSGLLDSAGAVLLIQMQRIIRCNITWPSLPHLILWSVPRLLHRRLGQWRILPCAHRAILSALIGLVTADDHLIIPPYLLIYASASELGVHATRQLLLLQIQIIASAGSIAAEAAATGGLTLPISICILSRRRFLSQKYLLGVILKEIHTRIRSTAVLFEADEILRLLYELMMIIATRCRPTMPRPCQIEIVLLVSVAVAVEVLGVPHLRLARLSIMVWIPRTQMLPMRRTTRCMHILLMLKIVVVILINTWLHAIPMHCPWRYNSLIWNLFSVIAVAVILYVDIVVYVIWVRITRLSAMHTTLILHHHVVVLIAFARIVVSLFWVVGAHSSHIRTSHHIPIPSSNIWQPSLLSITTLPRLGWCRHPHMTHGLLPVGGAAIEMIMQPRHTTRPRIHLLFKFVRVGCMLAHILSIIKCTLSMITKSCLRALSNQIL